MTVTLPRKIREALERLGIDGVVSGYFTLAPHEEWKERAKGICQSSFTGWDVNGAVVCVLRKTRKKQWTMQGA